MAKTNVCLGDGPKNGSAWFVSLYGGLTEPILIGFVYTM
jgi:hypothetical protein